MRLTFLNFETLTMDVWEHEEVARRYETALKSLSTNMNYTLISK